MDCGIISSEEILEINRLFCEVGCLPSDGIWPEDFEFLRPHFVAHTLKIMLELHTLLELSVGPVTVCCDLQTQNICVLVMNKKQTSQAFGIVCREFGELWAKVGAQFPGKITENPYSPYKISACSNDKIVVRPHGCRDETYQAQRPTEFIFKDGRWNLFPGEKFGPFRSLVSPEFALFSPVIGKRNLKLGIVIDSGLAVDPHFETLPRVPVNRVLMMCIEVIKDYPKSHKKKRLWEQLCLNAQLGNLPVEKALNKLQDDGFAVCADDEMRVEMWNCARNVLLKQ